MSFNIAVDGPAGAGKSSIAKRVAKELSFIYVDTGAMYRAIAFYMIRNGISPQEDDRLEEACKKIHIDITYQDGAQQVILNGENVTGQLRTEEVGNMASAFAAKPCVRAALLTLQRDLAAKSDVLMDGRDIGTNILPGAQLKIYLTASVETRAGRRFLELQEKGVSCDLDSIKKDIEERDERDKNREIAPLKQAEDAVLVDSSDLTIDQVTNRIVSLYRERA
jgi:cytidylate kinase